MGEKYIRKEGANGFDILYRLAGSLLFEYQLNFEFPNHDKRLSDETLFEGILSLKSNKTKQMNLEENKKNAISFYKMAYEGSPKDSIQQYVGREYIQHNPDVADGTPGFIAYFERMKEEYPDKSIEFVRCIAEGDLVALHTHQTWPEGDEYVTMDFFRFDENGKICEHWDSIQQIPEKSANPNTMY